VNPAGQRSTDATDVGDWRLLPGLKPRHPRLFGVLAVVLLLTGLWELRLWHLRGEVADYRSYWSQVTIPIAPPGALRYVALGDSAAQGIGASDPQHGYVSLIADHLRASSGRPVIVINISESGARIDDVLRDQVPQLGGLHPDFVTVDVGGNDVRRYQTSVWSTGAASLCAQLPAGRSVVADVPWFMHGHWEHDARQARDALTQACGKDGVAVAPLAATFESHGWLGMFTLYAADWFHPNDDGHRLWADAIWSTVTSTPGLLGQVDPRWANGADGPSASFGLR